ncbi:unnamed protein product [Allacma fusca]|uniref:Uncharacterized protein n=1 Tax=Allacma fusca TaxID=39272 RepID=A0A8J2LCE6_9HEXA|nr:unnamed protein product [Allacma fusca]
MEGIGKVVLLLLATLSFSCNTTCNSQCSYLQCLRTGSTLWANGEVCNNKNTILVRSGTPFCLGTALRSRNSFTDWTATSRVTIENVTFPNTYSVKPFASPKIHADSAGKPDTCYTYREYPLVETEIPGALMRLKWTDNIISSTGSDFTHTHECYIQVL